MSQESKSHFYYVSMLMFNYTILTVSVWACKVVDNAKISEEFGEGYRPCPFPIDTQSGEPAEKITRPCPFPFGTQSEPLRDVLCIKF